MRQFVSKLSVNLYSPFLKKIV